MDKVTRILLTVIALCLLWMCFKGPGASSLAAQEGAFAIQADGNVVYRLNTRTGEIVVFVDVGNDPRSGRGWEERAVTPVR